MNIQPLIDEISDPRFILAVLVTVGIGALMILGKPVPDDLRSIALLIYGVYFGNKAAQPPTKPA